MIQTNDYLGVFVFVLICFLASTMVGLYWRKRFNELTEWVYVYKEINKDKSQEEW